jgi:hypothetical protein
VEIRITTKKIKKNKIRIKIKKLPAYCMADFKHHIVAFVNVKSGGRDGVAAAEALRKLLPARNVIDLIALSTATDAELEAMGAEIAEAASASGRLLRVIAAGGDGSINWTFSILVRMGLMPAEGPAGGDNGGEMLGGCG